MAGHEWLDDETVVELANYLVEMHHQDVQGRRKN